MKLIQKLLPKRCCHHRVNLALTGFTLVELVMTIVVVAIVAIPLSLLLFEHTEGTVQSSDRTMALNLARLEMEKVNNLAYANIVTASFSNYQGYSFDVDRTVSFVQGTSLTAESLKQVKVDVKRTGSATILATLVTYTARNVAYGL